MATYKVLQDIEAEDTLIGPLTLRQCIYAAIAALAGYLSFIAVTKHAAFLLAFLLPFVAFGTFFAYPWSKQQTTEVWALAKIRFFLKPRTRIWNQSGVKQLVTITVPKQIKQYYGKNLTETEVSSRLKALADTIDSRGWAVKNAELGYYTRPGLLGGTGSDRLVNVNNMPQEISGDSLSASADIFDVQNNPVAQKLDGMISASSGAHRQQIMQQMADPQADGDGNGQAQSGVGAAASLWHMDSAAPASSQTSISLPALPSDQPATSTASYSHLRTIQPLSAGAVDKPAEPVTPPPNPAILELANNNDLNVATLAREAQQRNPDPPDEVIVSLH